MATAVVGRWWHCLFPSAPGLDSACLQQGEKAGGGGGGGGGHGSCQWWIDGPTKVGRRHIGELSLAGDTGELSLPGDTEELSFLGDSLELFLPDDSSELSLPYQVSFR